MGSGHADFDIEIVGAPPTYAVCVLVARMGLRPVSWQTTILSLDE
ncbi:hypothetical protein [Humibacillus xanthopallidus]|uniref:Uncharacterized protein n=1 Tax=Humibacillus xanthopallidus TaxID=412689 RepID=A0A543HJN0_9MICO|nr:hypothetical protein [Humibacillus xanthopallidus]TQM58536.1 hypothetical protein FBY41_3904 [Humibacillus xanthopallidus]